MESKIFLSAREAEQAAYGPWGNAPTRAACEKCGCVIMEDDTSRQHPNGGLLCARCGKDG